MTLWEVDIHPAEGQPDLLARSLLSEAADLGLTKFTAKAARGFLVQGNIDQPQIEQIARELLADLVVEQPAIIRPGDNSGPVAGTMIHVLPKPGVTDPVAASTLAAIRDFGIPAEAVVTLRKYWVGGLDDKSLKTLTTKLLANDSIEQVVLGPLKWERLHLGSPYTFQPVHVPIRELNADQLVALSKQRTLSLTLVELQTIQRHYCELGREPTDIELETIAQTWSEHCSHKTLTGRVTYTDEHGTRQFGNLLKETIFAATQEIRKRLGKDDWCVSVFRDNAGVVKFDDEHHVAFKVETHNRPSAIEPYGGANTGIGGVIRDTLGTGLGAKPIASTDVFCFAPPDAPAGVLPPGVLHPRRIMRGVVSGVRDYGNRMGIPTVNGAIYFDPRYVGNPLVFCGNIGLIPTGKEFKQAQAGDYIVAVGGRTGRDGIHGATFSSAELTHESEKVSGGAVQIGNAITEKMVLDVLLAARDEGLYSAVTDCGAGGFSSAVGEMGAEIGAEVWLEKAPLKYEGLSYTEIWISEAQERMVLAVPEEKWPRLKELCDSENVEAVVIGRYVPTGKLELKYKGTSVGQLDMHFLHEGRPNVERQATYRAPAANRPDQAKLSRALDIIAEQLGVDREKITPETSFVNDLGAQSLDTVELVMELEEEFDITIPEGEAEKIQTVGQAIEYIEQRGIRSREYDWNGALLALLSSLNIASKEWVIRQYDHEVQGGSVIKPLVGAANDGPSDAAVLRPVLSSRRGLVVACGMNPRYGDLDPYHMATCAIDEAVRNCVAVGAEPRRIAILDNFCWGYTDRPETLGALVRAALACYDVAVAWGTPFISGKDSLNNEFSYAVGRERRTIQIPHTLLISALGQIDDVRACVTMDLKTPGNLLYQIGATKNELGGSHWELISMPRPVVAPSDNSATNSRGFVPQVDVATAKRTFAALHDAIRQGHVRACHDLSEGGLAVALAEMAFAGNCGAMVRLAAIPTANLQMQRPEFALLFSESASRFLAEVPPANHAAFEAVFRSAEVPCNQIGEVTNSGRLQIDSLIDLPLADLKEAWQKPLRW